jgi:hypothetical protein
MPAFVLTSTSTVQCPHGGMASVSPSQTAVKADGAPVLTENDVHTVVGCSFNVSSSPNPCVTIAWSAGAQKVSVGGSPALIRSSVGQCKSGAGAVQGMAVIANTQTKVKAT